MRRISLENDDLEGANNAYLLDTDDETVLVDTGEPTREEKLRDELAAEGVSFADVDEIFLTHWHPDHSGLAGTIQEASGATVRIHDRDAGLVTRDQEAWFEFMSEQQSRLDRWGVPDSKRTELFSQQDGEDISDEMVVSSVTPFSGGETFDVGNTELEVVHTPGHSAGSVCFALDGTDGTDREIITGDTILPNYTPNVGGTDTRMDHPLEWYLSSLHALVDADYDIGWPGHREPITDPTNRAREIIAHHEQRAGQILTILERLGSADVWTVCTELFGELERYHILVGAGEAFAHLVHLEQQGDVERVDGTFRIVNEVRSELDGDIDTWSLSVSSPDMDLQVG